MKHTKRLFLKTETVRTLTAVDLARAAGGISSDCSKVVVCAVPTSKQPWCNDTFSASCPR